MNNQVYLIGNYDAVFSHDTLISVHIPTSDGIDNGALIGAILEEADKKNLPVYKIGLDELGCSTRTLSSGTTKQNTVVTVTNGSSSGVTIGLLCGVFGLAIGLVGSRLWGKIKDRIKMK